MSYRNQPSEFARWSRIQARIIDIDTAVKHARCKHPVFPRSWWGKFAVLLEEVAELIWAVVWERDPQRIRAEALDCIAVLVRIVEGD